MINRKVAMNFWGFWSPKKCLNVAILGWKIPFSGKTREVHFYTSEYNWGSGEYEITCLRVEIWFRCKLQIRDRLGSGKSTWFIRDRLFRILLGLYTVELGYCILFSDKTYPLFSERVRPSSTVRKRVMTVRLHRSYYWHC